MPRAGRVCKRSGCPAVATRDGWCETDALLADEQRGTTTQRGYGSKHQKKRAELIQAMTPGQRCPLCTRPMLSGMDLDLHHSIPQATREPGQRQGRPGDQLAHTACNLAAEKTTGRLRPGAPLPEITYRRTR